eukprot:TRINITY_DN645_c4_g1_i1.p1 TRINITY_DN645_c4_g1~~TRINITY_DN645_c4_g1_i1.p1  ORF type:complete len:1088 (-),score=206.33 TRINITY_DN645_c4_g1_i1:12-3275(-)
MKRKHGNKNSRCIVFLSILCGIVFQLSFAEVGWNTFSKPRYGSLLGMHTYYDSVKGDYAFKFPTSGGNLTTIEHRLGSTRDIIRPLNLNTTDNLRVFIPYPCSTSHVLVAGEHGFVALIGTEQYADSVSLYNQSIPSSVTIIGGAIFQTNKQIALIGYDGVKAQFFRRNCVLDNFWIQQISPGSFYPRSVTFGTTSLQVVVVGDNGVIRLSTNAGGTWSSVVSSTTKNIYGVISGVDGKIIALGGGSVVRRFNSDGTGMEQITRIPAGIIDYRAVQQISNDPSGKAFITVGNGGTVVWTTDNGYSWDYFTPKCPNIVDTWMAVQGYYSSGKYVISVAGGNGSYAIYAPDDIPAYCSDDVLNDCSKFSTCTMTNQTIYGYECTCIEDYAGSGFECVFVGKLPSYDVDVPSVVPPRGVLVTMIVLALMSVSFAIIRGNFAVSSLLHVVFVSYQIISIGQMSIDGLPPWYRKWVDMFSFLFLGFPSPFHDEGESDIKWDGDTGIQMYIKLTTQSVKQWIVVMTCYFVLEIVPVFVWYIWKRKKLRKKHPDVDEILVKNTMQDAIRMLRRGHFTLHMEHVKPLLWIKVIGALLFTVFICAVYPIVLSSVYIINKRNDFEQWVVIFAVASLLLIVIVPFVIMVWFFMRQRKNSGLDAPRNIFFYGVLFDQFRRGFRSLLLCEYVLTMIFATCMAVFDSNGTTQYFVLVGLVLLRFIWIFWRVFDRYWDHVMHIVVQVFMVLAIGLLGVVVRENRDSQTATDFAKGLAWVHFMTILALCTIPVLSVWRGKVLEKRKWLCTIDPDFVALEKDLEVHVQHLVDEGSNVANANPLASTSKARQRKAEFRSFASSRHLKGTPSSPVAVEKNARTVSNVGDVESGGGKKFGKIPQLVTTILRYHFTDLAIEGPPPGYLDVDQHAWMLYWCLLQHDYIPVARVYLYLFGLLMTPTFSHVFDRGGLTSSIQREILQLVHRHGLFVEDARYFWNEHPETRKYLRIIRNYEDEEGEERMKQQTHPALIPVTKLRRQLPPIPHPVVAGRGALKVDESFPELFFRKDVNASRRIQKDLERWKRDFYTPEKAMRKMKKKKKKEMM